MDLELDEDQQVLAEGARAVLADACPPALVRAVVEDAADAPARRSELWATLVALDWPGLGLPEAVGGLGLGFVEVAILVEELGRVVAPTPLLATSTQLAPLLLEVEALGGPDGRAPAGGSVAAEVLAGIAAGTVTGSMAVAEAGRWDLAEVACRAEPTAGGGWRLTGSTSHVLDGTTATELAVVARGADGLGAFLVPGPGGAPAAGLAAEPLAVMDPTMPLATVVLDGVDVPAERVLVAPGDPRSDEVVGRALEAATVALALSTVATCRSIFDDTLAYAKEREQFGRPIGSFQAIKHRLADAYLAVERAHALAWYAVLCVAEDDDRRAVATSMAKSVAGDCQRLLTRDGLQLHGGIGFTWEHDLHLWLKRAATGELLAGTSLHHRARLAALLGLEAVA